ncbi:MAG: CYTH and CHAD domain-containing protein [Pseudomonadota bacterium]
MPEIELKFLLDEAGARRLKSRLKSLSDTEEAPRARNLRSVYYDTPDHVLKRAGIALRLRRDGRRWIQTVKAKTKRHGAMQSTEEAENYATGGRLQLHEIPDAELQEAVLSLVNGSDLEPVCETEIKRTAATVRTNDGSKIELAVDEGEIKAGEAARAFREAELELVEGRLGALFDLTQELFPKGGLKFSRMSKAGRGYMLHAEDRIETPLLPRNAAKVPLDPMQSSETAARDVLRECFEQISQNVEVMGLSDDPEGPHQLRVGLRRLRSAFSVFKPAIGNPEMERLNTEARWLGQEVGSLRDLDVAVVDLLDPAAEQTGDAESFSVLRDAIVARGTARRAELRDVLQEPRTHSFVIDLARFIEARGWLLPNDFGQTTRLARPISDLAVDALDKRWKSVRKHARGIDTLSIEERHELRKELKKLRYAVEFLGPLFAKKQVDHFVRHLKSLQAIFGDLNDLAMAEELLTVPNAPGADEPAAQRAVGWILGSRGTMAEYSWHEAKSLWHGLKDTRQFWH